MGYSTAPTSLVTTGILIVENSFFLSRKPDHTFKGLCEYTGGNHLVMFGPHWSSANEYIAYVICYVVSQDGVIERSCTLIVCYHCAKFGDHNHCVYRDMMILVLSLDLVEQ